MRRVLLVLLLLIAAPLAFGGTATVMLTPNPNTQFGSLLASSTSSPTTTSTPTLTFGPQGTSTSSPALTVLVTNCQNNSYINAGSGGTPVQPCIGTGSLTLASSNFAVLSGTNAADWAISGGTCANSTVLTANQNCTVALTFTPTASAGTAETATLTISDNGTTSTQTMNLTGTSATVTFISSCQTLSTANAVYQLTANVSATGSCFPVQASGISLNLDGFTLTYGTSHSVTECFFGVFGAGSGDISSNCGSGNATGGTWNNLSVYDGTITEGDCLNFDDQFVGSDAIFSGGGSSGTGLAVFNVTFNTCSEGASAIFSLNGHGAGWNIHDDTVNSKVVTALKRSVFEGVAIVCSSCGGDTGTSPILFNIAIFGGPQGAIYDNSATGAQVYSDYAATGNGSASPGFTGTGTTSLRCGGPAGTNSANPYTNSAGTSPTNAGTECTNDFSFYAPGKGANVYGVYAAPSEGRGIFCGNLNVTNVWCGYNIVTSAQEFANNSEYQGCQIGGAFGTQIDNDPSSVTISHENATAISKGCAASGWRVTDSRTYNNISENNTYTASRAAGDISNCGSGDMISNPENCAFGASFDAPGAGLPDQLVTSQNDTFVYDTAAIYWDHDCCVRRVKFISPTFNKGGNVDASYNHFMIFRNAAAGAFIASFIMDPTYGSGVSFTDTDLPAQCGTGCQVAASVYESWTQTYTITTSTSVPILGAIVTLTDSHSNVYSCTTNSSGKCAPLNNTSFGESGIPPVDKRDNNDTGANQVDTGYNPYTLQVSAPGFLPLTITGITVSATASITEMLSGSILPAKGIILSGKK